MVRMLAPIGVSHLSTFTGRQTAVLNDRVVEVSAEDAGPLKGAGFTEVKQQTKSVC